MSPLFFLNLMFGKNIKKLLYKRVPSFYYTYSSDEDLYALFRNGAKISQCDMASTIYLPDRIKLSKGKKWGISRAKQAGIVVKKFDDLDFFIEKENETLKSRHNAKAVHTGTELKLLAERFSENIALYGAFFNNDIEELISFP